MNEKLPETIKIVLYQCLNEHCRATEIKEEEFEDVKSSYIVCVCTAGMRPVDSATYTKST